MQITLIGAIAFGVALYLSKLGLFLLFPKWIRNAVHNHNILLIALDVGLSYTILHLVSIAGGYLALIVAGTFGICSIIYIYTCKGVKKATSWVKAAL